MSTHPVEALTRELHPLHRISLARSVKALEALNIRYRIELPTGQQYGDLEMPDPVIIEVPVHKPREKRHNVPRGELTKRAIELIKDVETGELVDLTIEQFGHEVPIEVFGAALCGAARKLWGIGSGCYETDKEIPRAMRRSLVFCRSS